eukprot:EG_transcript_60382
MISSQPRSPLPLRVWAPPFPRQPLTGILNSSPAPHGSSLVWVSCLPDHVRCCPLTFYRCHNCQPFHFSSGPAYLTIAASDALLRAVRVHPPPHPSKSTP